jgi:hypothetical protein
VNTKLVNSAAGVINAALGQDRTAAGIALALESARLLMSPETAAEHERVAKLLVARTEDLLAAEARISALESERHSTNESLDDAVRALRERDEQVRLLNTQRGDVAQLVEREQGYGEECVDIDDLVAALGLGADEFTEAGGE